VSDPEMHDAKDAMERHDEEDDVVEAHSLDSRDAHDEKLEATEEPPDVEGHSFDAPASMDAMDQQDA
jgi:hypothetical protein